MAKLEHDEKMMRLTDLLSEFGDNEIIDVWNEYERANGYEDEIFTNDEEFFKMNFSEDIMRAVAAATYGDYNLNDDYVKFNGYANLESFDYPSDVIDFDELADYILREDDDLYYNEIRELLDEFEEEENEDDEDEEEVEDDEEDE